MGGWAVGRLGGWLLGSSAAQRKKNTLTLLRARSSVQPAPQKQKIATVKKIKTLLYILATVAMVLLLKLLFGMLTNFGSNINAANMKTKEDFLKRAIEIAKENIDRGGGPFGAVIVKDGKIIAESGNTVTLDMDPTAHAEVNAIRKACKVLNNFELKDCELYTSCEPCPMCLSSIYWTRLKKVYYAAGRKDAAKAGFDDDFIYKELELEMNQRSIDFERLEVDESLSPFEKWENFEEKTRY